MAHPLADANWVRHGDRSHPNLKLIDEELLLDLDYDGYHNDLQKLEAAHLDGRQWDFDELLFQVREKQKLHEGDRSHPRLVELDSLRENLSYEGWQQDFDNAFEGHINCGDGDVVGCFKRKLEGMRRKQAISVGDWSHEHLVFLHSLQLSYPGWEKEYQNAIDCHCTGHSIEDNKFVLLERQRMHDGDRSHARLVALDALSLTYPGWQQDVAEVERRHVEHFLAACDGYFVGYREHLERLASKQRTYEGNGNAPWVHSVQSQILATTWTYPSWQADVQSVRSLDSVSTCSYTFEDHLEKCQLRQMIHDNNFHGHPGLLMLHELQLSYPGWEAEFAEAKNDLWENGYPLGGFRLKGRVQGMKNKQSIYEGSRTQGLFVFGRRNDAVVEDVVQADVAPAPANADTGDSGTCVICFDAPRTHIFVPCGHACACMSCAARVMAGNKKCPICNKASKMTMEMFFP